MATANSFVTAKLMAEVAVDFNIGADILGKGNRAIEKELGAEQMTGDTVYVPIMDGGKVFHDMDLSNANLSVKRDVVPVTVGSSTTAASVDQMDLTLSIQNPELMAKRVANLANDAQLGAYRCLCHGSTAFVASDKTADVVRTLMFDAEAHTTGSKMGGNTFGVSHPMTYNRLAATLQANFGANQSLGKNLYENELGNFMGYAWSKGSDMETITATAQNFGDVTLTDGSTAFTHTGDGPASPSSGDVSQPFTVAGVYGCDALGVKTGRLATFYATYNGTAWVLTYPASFTGARKALYCAAINDATETVTTVTGASADQLVAGTTYLSPAVLWKQNDFLVAVKGLEKFMGCDSFTIPTAFKDRGILPLRGTAWTDPLKSQSIFRVDVLLGYSLYQRVSVSSIYLPA